MPNTRISSPIIDNTPQNKKRDIIDSISQKIIDIIPKNEKLSQNNSFNTDKFSCFYYKDGKKPSISYKDYLNRIKKYTDCSSEVFLITLIYLKRFFKISPFDDKKLNIHKILFICFLEAIKYHEDDINDNKFYSQVAGIPNSQLFYLECEFLDLMNYNMFVHEKEFQEMKNSFI